MNYLDLHMLTYLALAAQQQGRACSEILTRANASDLSRAFLIWADERGRTSHYVMCLEHEDKIECFGGIAELCEPFLTLHATRLVEQFGFDEEALLFAQEALPYVFVRMPEEGTVGELADRARRIFNELYRRTAPECALSTEDRRYLELCDEVMRPGSSAEITERFRKMAHGESD